LEHVILHKATNYKYYVIFRRVSTSRFSRKILSLYNIWRQ